MSFTPSVFPPLNIVKNISFLIKKRSYPFTFAESPKANFNKTPRIAYQLSIKRNRL
jgi:hypothetical protein